MSARREPPAVPIAIRCGWPRCRRLLGRVHPIRPRLDGDPQALVVTRPKKSNRYIESMIPADFSGNITIALCAHHPLEAEMVSYPAIAFKNLLLLARRTGRMQEFVVR